jgi:hypothetical protein
VKKKRPSKRKPAAKKAGKKPGTTLTKQPHGGAIHQGPAANVVPGPGRPASAIRAALARSFDERRPVYEMIADGQATERIEFDFKEMLPYLLCGSCGADPIIRKDTPVDRVVISAWRSARTRDRLRAMDSMGKFGIGDTPVEFADIRQHPDAQRFMHAYHEALKLELSEAVAGRVAKRVDELLQVAATEQQAQQAAS